MAMAPPPRVSSRDVDGGWAWVIMIAATAWNIMVSGTLKTFSFVFMEFQDIFHSSATHTAWMGFTFSFMLTVISPVAGYLSDHLPARWIAMVAALTGTLGILLTGLAPSITCAILTYGLIAGTGAAVMDTPVFGMLNQYFIKKRALANSVAFAGSGVGCVVFPLVLNFAIEHYAARGSMFLLAGLWLHGCIIAAVLRPLKTGFVLEEVSIEPVQEKAPIPTIVETLPENSDTDRDSKVAEDTDETRHTQTKQTEVPASFSDRLLTEETRPPTAESIPSCSESVNSRNVIYAAALDYWDFLKNLNMVFCVFGIMLGGFAYFNQLFLFPLLAQELGYRKLDGAMLLSITGLSETISRLLMSGILDKKWINKTLLVVSCSFICSILGLLLTLHTHWYVLVTYAFIFGTIGGTMIPLAMPILTEHIRMDRVSSATGLFLWAIGSAFATGPPVLSFVKDLSGFYVNSFRFCVCVYWPACLLFLLVWLRKRAGLQAKEVTCCPTAQRIGSVKAEERANIPPVTSRILQDSTLKVKEIYMNAGDLKPGYVQDTEDM